jgi:hypothetical protein
MTISDAIASVMAGLVPAVALRDTQCLTKRDHRNKPGDDNRISGTHLP